MAAFYSSIVLRVAVLTVLIVFFHTMIQWYYFIEKKMLGANLLEELYVVHVKIPF